MKHGVPASGPVYGDKGYNYLAGSSGCGSKAGAPGGGEEKQYEREGPRPGPVIRNFELPMSAFFLKIISEFAITSGSPKTRSPKFHERYLLEAETLLVF